MPRMIGTGLSRREREILDALYEKGEATAAEVVEALDSPPSYSAVRTLLRILEEKGHVSHRHEGRRYLYRPTLQRESAAASALRRVVSTFFGGSLSGAVRAFLSDSEADLSDEELARLSALVEEARASSASAGNEEGKA